MKPEFLYLCSGPSGNMLLPWEPGLNPVFFLYWIKVTIPVFHIPKIWWRLVEILTVFFFFVLFCFWVVVCEVLKFQERIGGWSVPCPQWSCSRQQSDSPILHCGVWRLEKRHFLKRIQILKQLRWCMQKHTLWYMIRDFYYFPHIIIIKQVIFLFIGK